MNYFYYALQTEEQRIAIGNLEMFDEYEVSLPSSSSYLAAAVCIVISAVTIGSRTYVYYIY